MDEIEACEREMMCDPENEELRARLIRLYREKLGANQQRAEFLCLTVWHPHAEAIHVTRATRFMGTDNPQQREVYKAIRSFVGARDGEEVMIMVTTGSLVPTRVPHRPEYRAKAPDVTVVVGCDWILGEMEKQIAKGPPPARGPRRRRRW